MEDAIHDFFFSDEDEAVLIKAIQSAENKTSGEIRVHLEDFCEGDPLGRTREVFTELKMNETCDRNGVLIYIAVRSHKFGILGDEGFVSKASKGYWDDIIKEMQDAFMKGEYLNGLVSAIEKVGQVLHSFFPSDDSGKNQLPDTISRA